jgi:hypothetical protein
VTDFIKKFILYMAKYLGLFYLTKLFYRNRIRILCYHGFSIRNEELFVPGLFIKPEIFDRRMKYLKDKNFNVISLEDAYQAVKKAEIIDNSVVITIDDGFYSTYSEALSVLKKTTCHQHFTSHHIILIKTALYLRLLLITCFLTVKSPSLTYQK